MEERALDIEEFVMVYVDTAVEMANRLFFPDDYYFAVNSIVAKNLGLPPSLVERLHRPFHWVALTNGHGNGMLYMQDTAREFDFPVRETKFGRFYVKTRGRVSDEEKKHLVSQMLRHREYFKTRYEDYKKLND